VAEPPRAALYAFAVPLFAAFVWSTYYFFVYGATGGVGEAGVLSYPFLVGGGAYFLWALARGEGRVFLSMFGAARAWIRVGLLVGMQMVVLISTYTAGAIDTSLLSLVGDVVLTPLLVMMIFREGRERLGSPVFLTGVVGCAAGATLAILASGSAQPLAGYARVAGPLVPILVPAFFMAAARESRSIPVAAVVGQANLTAGLVTLPFAPLVPGGVRGLYAVSPLGVLLVVGLGLTSFFLADVLYFAAVDRAGLILPTVLMAGVPVFTLALSWALLRQTPPPIGLAGIPIAVGGAILALRGGPLADSSTHPRRRDRIAPIEPEALPDGVGSAPPAATRTR
jgi:drug/metabolite transporter (DMT)-like permease